MIVDDAGSVNGATTMNPNADADAATANALAQDLTTNDVDTNFANGL